MSEQLKPIKELEKGCNKYCYDKEYKDIICGQRIEKDNKVRIWRCPECKKFSYILGIGCKDCLEKKGIRIREKKLSEEKSENT